MIGYGTGVAAHRCFNTHHICQELGKLEDLGSQFLGLFQQPRVVPEEVQVEHAQHGGARA